MTKEIRDEMNGDMLDGCMPVGEIESCLTHWGNKYEIVRKSENESLNSENKEIIRKLIAAETRMVQLEKENERLKSERDSNWISLERAKKYARHQHYLGTQGNELVEFEDWECKPPKQ